MVDFLLGSAPGCVASSLNLCLMSDVGQKLNDLVPTASRISLCGGNGRSEDSLLVGAHWAAKLENVTNGCPAPGAALLVVDRQGMGDITMFNPDPGKIWRLTPDARDAEPRNLLRGSLGPAEAGRRLEARFRQGTARVVPQQMIDLGESYMEPQEAVRQLAGEMAG